jgi:MFS family permease
MDPLADDTARPHAAAPGRREVLALPGVRRFLAGYAATMTGTAMTPVALAFAVLDRGGDAGDVGLVLMAEAIPLAALLLVGGVIADRLPRKRVLVTSDLVRAVSQLALAATLLLGDPSLGVLMALAAVLGAGQAFGAPAFNAVVPSIVPPEHHQPVNAMASIAAAIGESLGPALGGLLVATVGAGWAIAFDGGTYLFSAWCIAGLKIAHEGREAAPGFLAELREGWDAFRSRTWIWVVVLQFSALHLLVLPAFLVVGAVVADDHLGGSRAWGLAMGAMGVGMVIGGLVMIRYRPQRLLLVGVIALTALVVPLVALALTAPLPVVLAATLLSGVSMPMFETAWLTSLQQHVEPEALSRVNAYDWFGSVATLPLGYAIIGPLSSTLGDSGALWLAAGVWVVASAVVVAVPAVRHLRVVAGASPDRSIPGLAVDPAVDATPTAVT